MMRPALLHFPFEAGKKPFYLILILKILIIFKASLISVAGQHSEISIKQKQKPDQIKPPHAKQGNDKKHKCQYDQKAVKPVTPISSHHKSVHFFSHVGHTFQNSILRLLISYSMNLHKSIKSF